MDRNDSGKPWTSLFKPCILWLFKLTYTIAGISFIGTTIAGNKPFYEISLKSVFENELFYLIFIISLFVVPYAYYIDGKKSNEASSMKA